MVALSSLEGPALPGLPADELGFTLTDDRGRVEGLQDVYAVGDGTSFPIKQGGIAAQQADLVAEDIALRSGAAFSASAAQPTLRGALLTGLGPLYLRARLGAASGASEIAAKPSGWAAGKIAGRYLAPYLARGDAREEGAASAAEPRPDSGSPIKGRLP